MFLRVSPCLIAIAVVLTFVGCGGDDDDGPTASPGETILESPVTIEPNEDEGTPGGGATAEPLASGWSDLAPVPTARSEVAVAELNGKIYVIGGFEASGSVSAAVEVYDPATDSWGTAAPLPAALHHTAAASAGGRLYLLGGFAGSFTPVASAYEYDPEDDNWTEIEQLPTPRGGLVAVTLGDEVYAIGGAHAAVGGNAQSVGAVEVYNPESAEWRSVSPMPTPRDHLAAVVVDGKIYALGGRPGLDFSQNMDVNEVYDPVSDDWETLAPMPRTRSGIAAGAIAGRVYVVGGESNFGTFEQNDAYDLATDTWSDAEPMPTARHGMGAVVIDGVMYVPAGGPVSRLSVSPVNEAFVP